MFDEIIIKILCITESVNLCIYNIHCQPLIKMKK